MAQRSGTVTVVRAIRKLRLSRRAAGRDASCDRLVAADAASDPDGLAGLIAGRALHRSWPPTIPAGPQTFTVDAARLGRAAGRHLHLVLRAQTAVGEQVLRASFKLDRRRTDRAVGALRGCTGAVPSWSCGCRTRRRCACSPARESSCRGGRALRASTASASGCPPACRRACACNLVDSAGNAGRAGPFVSRRRTS